MTEKTENYVIRIPTEVYSRIVGYLRPVQNWNKGKVQEWKERKTYSAGLAFKRMEEESKVNRSYL